MTLPRRLHKVDAVAAPSQGRGMTLGGNILETSR